MNPGQNRVAVVGSVNLDLTIRVHELPSPGRTMRAVSTFEAGGGKGANAALAAALTGTPTSLIAATGDDRAARLATADLADAGIDLTCVLRAPLPTGTATVLVDDAGQNCIIISAGANEALAPAHVTAALNELRDVTVVLTNLEIPDDAVLAAAEFAAQHAATLIVNPAPPRPLPNQLLHLQPILTPNEDELTRLTGSNGSAGAQRLYQRTGSPVIITRGGRGALVVTDAGTAEYPAPPAQAIDTSGAGDVFNGTLAGHLATGHTIPAAVKLAVAAASASTEQPGARLRGSTGFPRG